MDFLTQVSEMLAPFILFFGVTGVVIMGCAVINFLLTSSRTGAGFPMGTLIIGLIIAVLPMIPRMMVGFLTIGPDAAGVETAGPGISAPTASPTPADPGTVATPPDFSWLGNFALIAGIILLTAVIIGGFLKFGAPAIVNAREQARRAKALMGEATEVYGQTMLASASYETDLGKQIDFPIMTDVTNPATSKYVKAMKNANLAIRTTPAKPSLAQAEHLMAEVQEFSVAFDAAERQAIRLKWSDFTVAEQTRLKDARTSLELIERGGLSDEARNAQYKRIVRLVEGLVTITTKSVQALSTKVPMLSLAKGEPAEEGQNVRR